MKLEDKGQITLASTLGDYAFFHILVEAQISPILAKVGQPQKKNPTQCRLSCNNGGK